MLDSRLHPVIAPALDAAAQKLAAANISGTQITLIGLATGVIGLFAVGMGAYLFGFVLIVLSLFLSGIHNATRHTAQATPLSTLLNSAFRWIVYAGFPFFFALSVTGQGLGAAFLLFAYFLLFMCTPQEWNAADKPFYAFSRLIENSEIIFFMALCCFYPVAFAAFAVLFGAVCIVTAIARLWHTIKTLR